MDKLHRSAFLVDVKALLPPIRNELNQQHGLLHLEMEVVRRTVQDMIDHGERDKLTDTYGLLNRYLMEGKREIVNAIAVSLLERLNFSDGKRQRAWAGALMPPELNKQFHRIEKYHEERVDS